MQESMRGSNLSVIVVDSRESGLWVELTMSLASISCSLQYAASALSESKAGMFFQDVMVFMGSGD